MQGVEGNSHSVTQGKILITPSLVQNPNVQRQNNIQVVAPKEGSKQRDIQESENSRSVEGSQRSSL
jgi:uncharacterized protein YjlB